MAGKTEAESTRSDLRYTSTKRSDLRYTSTKRSDLRCTSAQEPVYSSFLLWYGVLAGPVIWFVHLFVLYGVATVVCAPGQVATLHIATFVAGLIALSSAVVGARARAFLNENAEEILNTISYRRARFLAIFAICNGIFFLAAIVVQSLPNFFFDPCLSVG